MAGARNRPLAAARRAQAVELAIQGCSYETIAREVGYTNRGTAYRAVKDALSGRTVEAVDAYRNLEQDRLDRLLTSVWPRAMQGDVTAVLAALKVVQARCRLLGLGGPEQDEADGASFASVVLSPAELARAQEGAGGSVPARRGSRPPCTRVDMQPRQEDHTR